MSKTDINEVEINGVTYVRKGTAPIKTGPEVIVRCVNSGVHIGTLLDCDGTEVDLANARRLWYWKGAFTLNAVATAGVDRKESRISVNVPSIKLLDACEVIPVADGVDLTPTEK